MTETNKPAPSTINTLIWAGAAVAITGMVVFVALPRLFPGQQAQYLPQPGVYPPQSYQQQAYVPPPSPYPEQQPAQPPPYAPPPQQTVAPAPSQTSAQPASAGVTPLAGISVDDGFEFNDAGVSRQVIELTKKTKNVMDVPAGKTPSDANTIIAFVDPTCPYCKQAHEFLNDKYVVRYVPVDVLNNGASEPNIRGVLKDKDGAAALRRLMGGDSGGLNTAPDPALDQELRASLEVFAALSAKMPKQRPAVPLFLIPKSDGKVAAVQGWNDTVPALLQSYVPK